MNDYQPDSGWDLVSKYLEKAMAAEKKLQIAIKTLRLIAGSDGAECSYPRAEAAQTLRDLGIGDIHEPGK